MRILSIVLLVASVLTGCHSDKPAHLLPEDTYVNLLVELQLLKSYQEEQHPDTHTVDSLRQAIFKKYGTTKQQFQKSNTYYNQHIDQQNENIKEAIDRLRKDHTLAQDSLKRSKHNPALTDTAKRYPHWNKWHPPLLIPKVTDSVEWYLPSSNYPKIPFINSVETRHGASQRDSNFLKIPFNQQ